MKKSTIHSHQTLPSAGIRAALIGRKLIPSLTFALALPFSSTAIADTEIFKIAGTTNWICPPGVTSVTVECWGGGGAGGAAARDTGATGNAGGGGGAAGAYARTLSVPVTPGTGYNVTIPAAATSPSITLNGVRNDGSAVSFTGDLGVIVTAAGGQGGTTARTTGAALSGSKGIGSTTGCAGDVFFAGGSGGTWSAGNGAAGGGGPSDLANGGDGATTAATAGVGATGSDANHNGGNGGAGKNGVGVGNAAASPGGGGGGAKATATPSALAGGNGGLGQIILTYTLPTPPSITKANNTDILNLGSSWVGGVGPTSLEVAKWNNTVTSANSTVLGADQTWAGIAIEDPAGLVTIGAGNTLSLGAASTDIDMSAATQSLTLNCPLALSGDNTWNVLSPRVLTLGGQVSGAFGITKTGTGVAAISSTANNYTGNTTVTAGTMRLQANEVIPNGLGSGNVTVTSTLNLFGKSETINGLSGTGVVLTNVASTTSTLTLGDGNATSTYSGRFENTGAGAILNLVKIGSGTQVLNGTSTSTMSGTVAVNGGTLGLSSAPLNSVTGITMGDGTVLRAQATDTTVVSPITLGGVGTAATLAAPLLPPDSSTATTKKNFNVNGVISGDGDLVLAGINPYNQYGRIILGAQNSYTGSTRITTLSGTLIGYEDNEYLAPPPNNANIFVQITAENTLPTTTVLTLDGGDGGGGGRFCELDLNGYDQTLAGLTNAMSVVARNQTVTNTGALKTLTINNSTDYSFGRTGTHVFNSVTYTTRARIQGAISLHKSGNGKFTLVDQHTYTGDTTITGGTLALSASDSLPGTTNVSIGAATLQVGAGASAATTGTLDCTGAATINLGDNTSAIAFGDSSAVTWAGTLTITGNFVSGSSIKFGTTDAALTDTQLGLISSAGFTGFDLDASGYLTATTTGGNTAPTISDIANQSVPSGGSVGPIGFTVGDTETAAGSLSLSVSANTNPSLVSSIVFGGIDGSRNVTVTPVSGLSGTATITIRVTDGGGLFAEDTFTLTVTDNYLSWAATNGVTGGPNGDSNNDGVKNLIQYALVDGGERGVLSGNTITFTKRGGVYGSDLTYIIETSETLGSGSWTDAVTHGPGLLVSNPTISYTFTPSTPAKKFARLKVVQVP